MTIRQNEFENVNMREDNKLEKALLVGVFNDQSDSGFEASLAELSELARAAGAIVIGQVIQRHPVSDPAFLVGKGKIAEIAEQCITHEADLVIFNDELSGSQIRNIEKAVSCKVIDRTFLILDIFARRARSHEGKLQVELAQQQYRLSRLTGLGQSLSRLGGGIGTRGPGESQLESSRRHINRRISVLRKGLQAIVKQREQSRKRRLDNELLIFAVVGYTNAGKSTLINRLCDSDLHAADQPFATLDPSVRRLLLPDKTDVLLVDTVGLIRHLPHQLIDAFRSTLEEITRADAILEVIDCSQEDLTSRLTVVDELINELGAASLPRFYVFNKIDLLTKSQLREKQDSLTSEGQRNGSIFSRQPLHWVSAETGEGLDELEQNIMMFAQNQMLSVKLSIPYREMSTLHLIHRYGRVDSINYQSDYIEVSAHIRYSHYQLLRPFVMLAEKCEEM
ncbi:MAG: GTPase HflX [Clostridiaceae bacterium]|nr:GTPase HflX [Clostridiaceae bacterium]